MTDGSRNRLVLREFSGVFLLRWRIPLLTLRDLNTRGIPEKNQAFKFQPSPCRVFGKHIRLSALSLSSSASLFPEHPLFP